METEDDGMLEVRDGFTKLVSAIRNAAQRKENLGQLRSETVSIIYRTVEELNLLFESGVEGGEIIFTSKERRTKLGTGIKSFGFTNAAFNSAEMNARFLPAYLSVAKFGGDIEMYTVLQRLLDALQRLERSVEDTVLYYADLSYRDAREYYSSVKTAARLRVPGAGLEFELLRKYFLKTHERRRVEGDAFVPYFEV